MIAISVALALAAGSAFAVDVTWDGSVTIGINLAQGENDYADWRPVLDSDDDRVVAGARNITEGQLRVRARAETDFGTFGAMARAFGTAFREAGSGIRFDAHAWWMPVDELWLGMGVDMAALGGMVRQGFHRGGAHVDRSLAQRDLLVIHHDNAFIGEFEDGFAVDVIPLGDMIRIGVGLPYPLRSQAPTSVAMEDIFGSMMVRATASLDFGRIGVGFRGGDAMNRGDIYAFFHSSDLVDGMGLDLGLRFGLGTTEDYSFSGDSGDLMTMAIGAGVNFDVTDEFGVRFRATAGFSLDSDFDYVAMNFEFLPHFHVTPNVSAFLYAGFGITMLDEDLLGDDNTMISWMINPYIRVNLGGPSFLAGFRVWGDNGFGSDYFNSVMGWEVPIGMVFSF
jgi:hypothetical protein